VKNFLSEMLNTNYWECQKSWHIATEQVFIFLAQYALQLVVWLHNRNTMLMQLSEQDCSHQPALMYTVFQKNGHPFYFFHNSLK